MKNLDKFHIGLGLFVMLLAVLLLPCAFIWSINTLFQLNLEYSFENILASFLFLSLISPHSKYSRK